ncbi:IctB family putative bicarbonate transporter [Calothrix sp. CCY 0018]|uniref:IctB family putative bicarbonate transporter n=1 Tax=Calothrix sp. CCY 0018 TaxID=3103864 RepID=UPI0039C5CCFD
MDFFWQQLTLSSVPLKQYITSSYLHRLLVGFLSSWRQTSILLRWGDAIAVALLSIVYILAPFVSNGLIGLLLAACVGFWLLLTISDEPANSNATGITPIHLMIFLYWGIATVATALSPVKKAAFTGWTKLTLYLLLFALCARLLKSSRIRSWLIAVYLHISLIVSVNGLRQWFFGAKALATWVDPESSLSKTTRIYSYLGNPNLLAGYILPAVILSFIAIFVWRSGFTKALAITMFIVNSACLILTFSRGGWIGLVASFLVLLVLLLYWWSIDMPPFWRTWSLPILLVSLGIVSVLAVLFVPPVRERVLSIFAGRGDSSNNFRINVWMAAIEMIKDRPVIGIGPGNSAFNKIYPLYQRPNFTALSAYSIFLEIAVETGLIGFVCFIWLLVVTFNSGLLQLRRLRQQRNTQGLWLIAGIVALVGMLGHGVVDTVWYRPQVNTLWWLMVGLVASYWKPLPKTQTNPINSSQPTVNW